uniref:zinc ribbon domain-containing protein n=1 Tax=Desulfovibrio oxyclinae TaxID=63560 RepID=UPI001FE15B38
KRRQEQQAREAEQAELRDCPYCAEPIKKKAIKCKHCGSDVEPEAGSSDVQSMTTQELEAEAARQALTEISQQSKPKVSTKHAMVLLTVGGALVALMIYGAMGRG